MLSIYPIKTLTKAVDYFKGASYYVQEHAELPGIWGGNGARLLGLVAGVKMLDFVNVLKGELPPDLMMPVTTKKRRLAYDLTFSAPKSISILALIAKDERVLAAHRVAVNSALSYLEEHYAATRVKKVKDKTTIEPTDNLLFAKFEHIESRALDPDLHTHIVLMNATRRAQQKWRSLYIDNIYQDQKLLGVIYRGKLVQELMQAGFAITQTSEQGFFELKGFSESLIKQFSKRREQIEQELAKNNLFGAKAAQLANFTTRPAKQKITLKELQQQWLKELPLTGINLAWLENYSAQALVRGPVTPPNPYQLAQQALQIAITSLSKWQPSFTTKKLLQVASGLSIVNFSLQLLEQALAEQFNKGQLLYLKDDICTTQANRDLEIANIVNMRQSKNKVVPMFTTSAALYVASKITQKPEQQLLLKQLLTNTDGQIVCSATTTVSYTEVMQLLVKIAKQYGFYPLGITQTVKRIESFTKELELTRVQTVAGFLMSCENRAAQLKYPVEKYKLANARQLWILDVAGGITAFDVNSLQKYAKQFGARIIWAYNCQRPQAAINALIQHGIKQYKLEANSCSKNFSALMAHPKAHIISNKVDIDDWQANTASTLIHWLAAKYQERQAVFSLKALQLELFSLGLTVPKEVLEVQLNLAVQQGTLIKLVDELITTKDTVLLEKACLELTVKDQGSQKSIMELAAINLPEQLTTGQKQAINLILTSKDRVVGIQGIAGSGKTTMLRTLNQLCRQAGVTIIGLATATSARERLQAGSKNIADYDALLRAGIQVFTTRKFLINSEKLLKEDPVLAHLEYGANKLFVLDEASFVSTAEMFAVLTKMIQLQTKLVFTGDFRQLPSIGSGRISYLMLGSNMQSVAIKENVRFNSAKALTVMKHIYNKQIPEALAQLGTSIIEIADYRERLTTMARLYLEKTPKEQANTILITPEHVDRKIVNDEIRQGLIANGQLQGAPLNCHNLTEIKLTKAEKQNIYYFKEQDWLYFSKTATNIERYNYYQIIVKDLENRTLVIEHVTSKEQIIWSPERQPSIFNIYRQEARSLLVNDQLRWLKNNELQGMLNGQSATVVAIKDNADVEVKLQNGKLIVLDFKQLDHQHWDYGYAATAFVAQGADRPSTIALARGGYVQEIMTKDIEIAKVIMVPELAANNNLPKYKWAKVLAITKDYIATVQDRSNVTFNIDVKQSATGLYFKDQAIWYSYTDPKARKKFVIPKLTSTEEFLVSVTRGDNVTLLVDHLESYQHTLEQKLAVARSALEFLASNRDEIKAKLQTMVENITGKANVINKVVNQEHCESKPAKERYSLYSNDHMVTKEQIINKLHSDILPYATHWLGPPSKKSSFEARWGKKGSLVVKLTGAKAGYWHDFEVGKGGKNLISLYMDRFNIDFKTAIVNLSKELNIYNATRLFKQQLSPHTNNSKQAQKLELLTIKKINYAKKLYAQGKPIIGTLAEKYLRKFRGIKGLIPDDFRFCAKLKHPDLGRMVPALIAPIKNLHHEIQGVVRIFLNPDGNKLNASYLDHYGNKLPATVKANLGGQHNAAVIIKEAPFAGVVYIAEGIETALSVAQAKPLDSVIAALSVSNLKNVPLPIDTERVILCADNDGSNTAANKALVNAAQAYLERGFKVAIAYPATIKGMAKVDFNDVLKILGVESIEKSLKQAMSQISNSKNIEEVIAIKELPKIANNIKEIHR